MKNIKSQISIKREQENDSFPDSLQTPPDLGLFFGGPMSYYESPEEIERAEYWKKLRNVGIIASIVSLVVGLVLLKCCDPAHAETIDNEKAVLSIIGEAENQGYQGMLAVACAIRNRGTLQGVYGLNAPRVKHHKYSHVIYEQAQMAWLQSKDCDVTNRATHWENTKAFGTPVWALNMTFCYEYKDHRFYKKAVKS